MFYIKCHDHINLTSPISSNVDMYRLSIWLGLTEAFTYLTSGHIPVLVGQAPLDYPAPALGCNGHLLVLYAPAQDLLKTQHLIGVIVNHSESTSTQICNLLRQSLVYILPRKLKTGHQVQMVTYCLGKERGYIPKCWYKFSTCRLEI